MRIAVTTSHKPLQHQVNKAKELAQAFGCRYIPRRHFSFMEGEIVIIAERYGISAVKDGKRLFFHPSLAVLRKSNVETGQRDYLIESLDLSGNEKVLDCTLGLGSEAILIAHFLPKGHVKCLESSKIIKIIVENGIRDKNLPDWVRESAQRIEILEYDYKKFVRESDEIFDCVYVDPMFEHPNFKSYAMNPLRPFADHSGIDPADIEEMKKIARKRIVVKARWNDSIFERYKFDKVVGSLKSKIGYGVVEI
ncbi:class I SAM-dependent methyltransferase [Athalassotoga saccharophila]|uniref:class I SAM-dependent methyltransferase n=1 Tax=Athalassotoga saccharophila TaxID=1441386 RepID=UPI001379A956|nr:class I SAM-dependent methyltransferase [Athalassotoga saccharophila]BBJ27916.1 ribosomal RNA small subunit methyltransferase J [Athalassotoga saccharophila]